MKANKINEASQKTRAILSSLVVTAFLLGASPSMAANSDHLEKLKESGKCADCNLNDADLGGENLRGVDLYRARLAGTNLAGADLQGAYLRRTDLRGANLSNANLAGVELSDVYLQNANLEGANLTGANLENSTFCNTTMPDGAVNNDNC